MDAQFDFVISIPNEDEHQQQHNNISPSQFGLQQHAANQQTPHQPALARRGSRKHTQGSSNKRNGPHQLSRAVGGSIACGAATTGSVYGASTAAGGETEVDDNTAQLLLEDNLEERLLSHVGMWDRRFVNSVIEAEFVMYFNRSRLPTLLWVALQTVLVVAILVSGSPEQPVFIGLCLTSLTSMGICACAYGYLYMERRRLNKGEHHLRPHPSPLSAAVDGGHDRFPDVWFRSEVLLATTFPWRNALRRNALRYECVGYLLAVSYGLLLAGTIWLKSSCDSSKFWSGVTPTAEQATTCRNSILFESSYLSSLCFLVVVTPQRFHQLLLSLGTVYLVAMLCPLMQIAWAQYVSVIVLYTLTGLITIICVYCLEQKKRDEFKQVVWSCAVAEQSQSLRRQEVRLTKAAFPFDVDAFLWDQEQDSTTITSPSNVPLLSSESMTTAAVVVQGSSANSFAIPQQVLSMRTRSLVIAESHSAVVCVARMDRYFSWSMAQPPKHLIAALQVMFTAFDELTAFNADSSTHSSITSPLDNSWGSAPHELGHSTSSSRNSTTGGVGASGSKNSSSSLFSAAKEKILKSTYGDAFLVVAFPTGNAISHVSANNHLNVLASRNPLSMSTNTSTTTATSKISAATSLVKRMIQFAVVCMVNGNDAISTWNTKRDPEGLNRPPFVVATVSTGRVVAAASGGARGVHVHFSGEPVSDALSPVVRQKNNNGETRRDAALRSGPSHLQGLSVVVRTEAQEMIATDALQELGSHPVTPDQPFSLYFPFGTPSPDPSLTGVPPAVEQLSPPRPPSSARQLIAHNQHNSSSDVMLNTSVAGAGASGTAPNGSHPQQRSFSSNFSVSFRRRVDGFLMCRRHQGLLENNKVMMSSASQRKSVGNVIATPQRRPRPDASPQSADANEHGSNPESLNQSTAQAQQPQQQELEGSAPTVQYPQPSQQPSRFAGQLRAAFSFVLFTPFPDEAVEAQYVSETRAFNLERLRFAAICGILVAAILITAETFSVTQDSVPYDSIMKISLLGNGLIWFILCAVWCLLIISLCAVFGASAAIATYYTLFVLYAVCYCIGVFRSAHGSVVRNSPVVWLMLLDALSVMRPTWEHIGIATIPDTVFLAVFLARNQRTFAGTGLMPGKLSRAFTAQLISTHVLYFAIRVIHERMERSFFATRQEAAEYTRQIERHVVALDDIIRTIAPDKRVARELSRTLHRMVELQQNSGVVVRSGSAATLDKLNATLSPSMTSFEPLHLTNVLHVSYREHCIAWSNCNRIVVLWCEVDQPQQQQQRKRRSVSCHRPCMIHVCFWCGLAAPQLLSQRKETFSIASACCTVHSSTLSTPKNPTNNFFLKESMRAFLFSTTWRASERR
ncbi:transmembrane protein, putative [Bodo saltans]|uniref:Transmembrane protein, putative n=1 Tax=Bodo saltans TaxID=75058 RepID=A0A0S4JN74_BODSA|nr:transmembrane protein, putative [Bodo saltans]|eukprot:CUG92115.1 transmembrane protein, putative [Bodo saltans]